MNDRIQQELIEKNDLLSGLIAELNVKNVKQNIVSGIVTEEKVEELNDKVLAMTREIIDIKYDNDRSFKRLAAVNNEYSILKQYYDVKAQIALIHVERQKELMLPVEEKLRPYREELKKLHAELSALTGREKKLSGEINRDESRLSELKKNSEAKPEDIISLESKIKNGRDELSSINSQKQPLNAKIDAVNKEKQPLEDEYATLSQLYEKLYQNYRLCINNKNHSKVPDYKRLHYKREDQVIRKAAKITDKLTESTENINKLTENDVRLKKELEAANEQLEELRKSESKELTALKFKVYEAKKEHSAEKSDNAAIVSELDKALKIEQKSPYIKYLSESESVRQLRDAISILKVELSDCTDKLRFLSKNQDEENALEKDIKVFEASKQKQEKQITDSNDAHLTKELAETNENLAKLTNELNKFRLDKEEDIAYYNGKKARIDKELIELTAKLEDAKAADSQGAKTEVHTEDVSALNKKLEQSNAKLSTLSETLASLESELEKVKAAERDKGIKASSEEAYNEFQRKLVSAESVAEKLAGEIVANQNLIAAASKKAEALSAKEIQYSEAIKEASIQKDWSDHMKKIADAADTEGKLLVVKNLKKYFPVEKDFFGKPTRYLKAVDDVSFTVAPGRTMGIVGESGCGKTTMGRSILRLHEVTDGEIIFEGKRVDTASNSEFRKIRPKMQIIFQDPYSSLSPRLPVGEIIGEAVRAHGIVPKSDYKDYIIKVMKDCGLQSHYFSRYPHEFSGGQRQRICIARALALNPRLVICDEPVSALDVSIQAQILNLLEDLQRTNKLTYVFISHDLSVVEHISDDVGVMYLGSLVESGEKAEIFRNPMHPYTEALFSAVPVPDPNVKMERIVLTGDIPSPANPPKGCKFHTRCHRCMDICKEMPPVYKEYGKNHWVACHLYSQD